MTRAIARCTLYMELAMYVGAVGSIKAIATVRFCVPVYLRLPAVKWSYTRVNAKSINVGLSSIHHLNIVSVLSCVHGAIFTSATTIHLAW